MPFLIERYDTTDRTVPRLKSAVPEGFRAVARSFFYDTAQSSNPVAMGALRQVIPVSQSSSVPTSRSAPPRSTSRGSPHRRPSRPRNCAQSIAITRSGYCRSSLDETFRLEKQTSLILEQPLGSSWPGLSRPFTSLSYRDAETTWRPATSAGLTEVRRLNPTGPRFSACDEIVGGWLRTIRRCGNSPCVISRQRILPEYAASCRVGRSVRLSKCSETTI